MEIRVIAIWWGEIDAVVEKEISLEVGLCAYRTILSLPRFTTKIIHLIGRNYTSTIDKFCRLYDQNRCLMRDTYTSIIFEPSF